MARAHYVSRANKNIYRQGKTVSYVSKKGKNKGKTLSKLDVTVPANNKDEIIIKKGEAYYWWQFAYGRKNFSKGRPKNSQLTQSAYLSTLYGIQESIEEISAESADDLQSQIDDIKSQLEELRDEQEEKRSNMPDSLQESPTGELLQERYDSLDNSISELDGIDIDYEEPSDDELREDAISELGLTPKEKDDDEEEVNDEGFTEKEEAQIEEKICELRQEKFDEWLNEKLEEIQGVSFD